MGNNRYCFPASPLLALLILLPALSQTTRAIDSRKTLEFATPTSLSEQDRLLAQGYNHSSGEKILVIRIDDRQSPPYADRINIERTLPPGPFKLHLGLGGLRTPAGRQLEPGRVRRIMAFQGIGDNNLEITVLRMHPPTQLPSTVRGWDLGPVGSAVWPGFSALTPNFQGIHGYNLKAIDRSGRKQAAEGLTTDGIRGIERLTLSLPKGRWFMTLWLRDPGEWEYLPNPLDRHITANGTLVWSRHHSSEHWIQTEYLAGRSREHQPGDDAWSLFGERHHERISFMTNVGENGLTLVFTGEQPEAGFVAAVLAEQEPDYSARAKIEEERAHWWRNNWRIGSWPDSPTNAAPHLQPHQTDGIIAAPDTMASLMFDLHQGQASEMPVITITPPAQNGITLETKLRWGQWRLRRSALSATLLVPDNRYLRSSLIPGNPTLQSRRLHLRIRIPPQAPAGQYHGSLNVVLGETSLAAPITITVPNVRLPVPDRPVGVYLERPPHFTWFDEFRSAAEQAVICDMRYLRNQGLTGIAPPLSTPVTAADMNQLIQEIRVATQAGFQTPFIAYAPFKRLVATLGLEQALSRLSEVETRLAAEQLPSPVWAIADEPSNNGQHFSSDKISRYARVFASNALLGGQLNHPSDRKQLDAFDLVLLNRGFGIDAKTIQDIKRNGVTPWLYNLENLRAAAGFYLWRVDAQGYLQWHARMPTADPFDPTDGREDDIQFLYPMVQPCPATPDVDASLFELTEGITDLRWLLWLDQQSEKNNDARKVQEKLLKLVPDKWELMEKIPSSQLEKWRRQIIELIPVAHEVQND